MIEIKLPFREDQIKKILIINLGGMGDLLLSLAGIKALKGYYPESEIVLLTIERAKAVAQEYKCFNRVYSFSPGFFPLCKTLFLLRRMSFDLAINMRTLVSCKSALKMAFLFSIISPGYSAGRDTGGRGGFLDIKVKEDTIGTLPEYQYDLDTVKALGIPAEFALPEIPVFPEDSAYIDDFLVSNKISKKDMIIAVNPFAPWQAKCWPIENFARLIKILKKEFPCKIIITGSREDTAKALRLKELARVELASAVGKTTFRQLADLIKRCSLYITNDTGPMHMAAILQVPLVALFGGGYLKRFDPRNITDKAVVLHKGVDCSPCNKKGCNSLKCLKEITPDDVIRAARELFNNRGPSS